jgi:ElaB/YqjD/DUF883 family membrane-anchored ribosome-binding protein
MSAVDPHRERLYAVLEQAVGTEAAAALMGELQVDLERLATKEDLAQHGEEARHMLGELRDETRATLETFRRELRDETRATLETFRRELRDETRATLETFRRELREETRALLAQHRDETRALLAQHREETRALLAQHRDDLRELVRLSVEASEHRIQATMRAEFVSQTRLFVFSTIGAVTAVGGALVAAVRL